jgi:hypothetical protein
MSCRGMRMQQKVTLSIGNAPIEGSVEEEGGVVADLKGRSAE